MTKPIRITLSDCEYNAVQQCVDSGMARSKSDFVRKATLFYIERTGTTREE